jgi:hypothetical protein
MLNSHGRFRFVVSIVQHFLAFVMPSILYPTTFGLPQHLSVVHPSPELGAKRGSAA